MQNKLKSFWWRAALTAASLLGLAGLAEAAAGLDMLPHGHFPALVISVTRGREIMDRPGVTGYYERLLAKDSRMDRNYVYDKSFLVYWFKPHLTWEHDHVTTNGFGMVGPETTLSKPPGVRRIALLGASISAGHMVQADQTFGALLERRLNADQPDGPSQRFEVLNFACIAYVLTQELDLAVERSVPFNPDVYLLDVNELATYLSWDRHLIQVVQQGIDPKYDFLRETLRQSGVSSGDDALILSAKLAPYRMTVLRDSFVKLKTELANRHTPLIAVLVPSVEEGELSRRRLEGVRDLLTSLDITVVDLLDTFDGILDTAPLAVYRGDVHPNARGHRMLSENLYTKLKAQPRAWAAITGHDSEGAAPAP
jgi:hypothetical protein